MPRSPIIQILLTAAAMLAFCALCTCFMSSCTKLFKQAEQYLECDEEIEMRFKVDIKDKEEQRLEKLESSPKIS